MLGVKLIYVSKGKPDKKNAYVVGTLTSPFWNDSLSSRPALCLHSSSGNEYIWNMDLLIYMALKTIAYFDKSWWNFLEPGAIQTTFWSIYGCSLGPASHLQRGYLLCLRWGRVSTIRAISVVRNNNGCKSNCGISKNVSSTWINCMSAGCVQEPHGKLITDLTRLCQRLACWNGMT